MTIEQDAAYRTMSSLRAELRTAKSSGIGTKHLLELAGSILSSVEIAELADHIAEAEALAQEAFSVRVEI